MRRVGVLGFVLVGLAVTATSCAGPSTRDDALGSNDTAQGQDAIGDAAVEIGFVEVTGGPDAWTDGEPDPGSAEPDSPEVVEDVEDVEDVGLDPCLYCRAPYEGCAQIDGQWYCVECTSDDQCQPSCRCNTEQHFCGSDDDLAVPCGADPPTANCSAALDCLSLTAAYVCDPTVHVCYDPQGSCDSLVTHCNWLEGASCQSEISIVMGPGVPGMPGFPGPGGMVCACPAPLSVEDLQACLLAASCPADGCFPGQACVRLEILCLFGDCEPIRPEGGMCASVSALEALLP